MGRYTDHIRKRKLNLHRAGLPQTPDDSDVLFTARADGKITIRTCVCEACGRHFQTEVWCEIDYADTLDDLIVLGHRAIGERNPDIALKCRENYWSTVGVDDAKALHDRVVDGFDAAMLEHFERKLAQSRR